VGLSEKSESQVEQDNNTETGGFNNLVRDCGKERLLITNNLIDSLYFSISGDSKGEFMEKQVIINLQGVGIEAYGIL